MRDMTNTNTILVIGSTGKTGRRVAARLTELGLDVRHGVRSSRNAVRLGRGRYLGARAGGRHAPRTSPTAPTWLRRDRREAITELAATRQRAPASSDWCCCPAAARRRPNAPKPSCAESGLEWTVVRATWFAQNFSEGNFADDVAAGIVALPVGDVLEPFVDADDIADVAVAALTDDRHVGQTYEVTGPRLLTFADAVAEISSATGERVVDCSDGADGRLRGRPRRLPGAAAEVDLLRYLFTTVLDGRNSSLADGVQRALGRAPKDFADFARDAAAAGVWVELSAGMTSRSNSSMPERS